MNTVNDPYYLNLIINLALLAVGAIAGFFTAKRIGQKDALELKNELITSLTQKVDLLEKEIAKVKRESQEEIEKVEKESQEEIDQLKKKNDQLQSTLDDLVAIEEARSRVAQKALRVHPGALPEKEEAP